MMVCTRLLRPKRASPSPPRVKTLATVTFQNYFRMYKKLSGMTGTASTEADEFSEIYGLNISQHPHQ